MKRWQFLPVLCALLLVGSLFAQNSALAQPCCVMRGDVNDNGAITSADIIYLVGYVFKGGPPPICMEHGYVNNDEVITSADIIYLVGYVFKSGPAPDACPAWAPYVFIDEYGPGVTYQAFGGSFYDAVQVDPDSMYAGTQGLSITIPDANWAGGAFTDSAEMDLSMYNAVTFYAKASMAATLDVAGLGSDNTPSAKYQAEVAGLPLTTDWQQYVIPFPLPSKLTAEDGLFYFAEGAEEGVGYTIWMDEIIVDSLATITNPRPDIGTYTLDVDSGAVVPVGNGTVIFDVDGTDITISAMPGYFTFHSSDSGVVSITPDGVITAEAVGSATLTADLGPTAAAGIITVNVLSGEAVPAGPAPTPGQHPDSVISLFSDVYTGVPVSTWSPEWDFAAVEDFLIGADSTKKYTLWDQKWAAIEFTAPTIDATGMTHFHMDVWTPDPTAAPAVFKVKLVDFGGDGAYGGGDDVNSELTFDENTMNTESWVSIDVPLASFTGLTTKAHLAQMILSGDLATYYVDNIYFYDSGVPSEPQVSAPTPSVPSAYVVSLFSDAYTDHPVDTWLAGWSSAGLTDFALGSDSMKQYTSLVFAGIEFTTTTIDATSLTHFHMDYWTPDPTANPAVFRIKLVDFGADGVWGGDDVEHELVFSDATTPALVTGNWVSFDIPLADFTGLTTKGHLAQLIINSDPGPNTVFLDNIYLYSPPPTEPPVSAPAPSHPSGDVISLFSDAYTDVTVDTWSAGWDNADVADYALGADSMKHYTNLVFAGIEFTSSTIDADSMTHFHMDIWTPDPTAAPAVFKIKLVDFGADGVWGGDDVEHELVFSDASTPALVTGSWVSFDIPLSDFTNLVTTGHMAQLIINADPGPNSVWMDNIYFHK